MQLPTRISKINNIEVTQLGESSITVENKSQENKKVGKRKPKIPRTKKKKYTKQPPKKPIQLKRTKRLENTCKFLFDTGEDCPETYEVRGETINIGGEDETTIYVKSLKTGQTICTKNRYSFFNMRTWKNEVKESKCTKKG